MNESSSEPPRLPRTSFTAALSPTKLATLSAIEP